MRPFSPSASAGLRPSGHLTGEGAGVNMRSVMRSPGTLSHLLPAPQPGPASIIEFPIATVWLSLIHEGGTPSDRFSRCTRP